MDDGDDPHCVGRAGVDSTGHIDKGRGMNSLALLVQEAFTRETRTAATSMWSVAIGKLVKILWHHCTFYEVLRIHLSEFNVMDVAFVASA
ncbi:hypothetical protein [Bradyrhizobium japonicum]|uniref:hypothetical protein n=1 Tax=Bradyrhizobium japonicum TaxID=375 RepID=UPI0009030B0D|nr:hypothetical protein [Bradyrhizobium japonicum]